MVDDLLKKYRPISDQVDETELKIILNCLDKVLAAEVAGDIVELGCYVGTTSLFLQRLLLKLRSRKQLHVYDSFAGLPEKSTADLSPAGTDFKKGELAASKSNLVNNFRRANLPLPVIHKAWYSDLTSQDLPDKIAFAFLDGDFYDSIADSLRLIQTKLSPGAIIIVDDYHTETLPGAKRAVDEWVHQTGYTAKTQASLAIIELPQ